MHCIDFSPVFQMYNYLYVIGAKLISWIFPGAYLNWRLKSYRPMRKNKHSGSFQRLCKIQEWCWSPYVTIDDQTVNYKVADERIIIFFHIFCDIFSHSQILISIQSDTIRYIYQTYITLMASEKTRAPVFIAYSA